MKQSLRQLLGLQCRHHNKSRPICRRQHCTDCGEVWVFDTYDLTEADHRPVDHYQLHDPSIRRVNKKVKEFRRRA